MMNSSEIVAGQSFSALSTFSPSPIVLEEDSVYIYAEPGRSPICVGKKNDLECSECANSVLVLSGCEACYSRKWVRKCEDPSCKFVYLARATPIATFKDCEHGTADHMLNARTVRLFVEHEAVSVVLNESDSVVINKATFLNNARVPMNMKLADALKLFGRGSVLKSFSPKMLEQTVSDALEGLAMYATNDPESVLGIRPVPDVPAYDEFSTSAKWSYIKAQGGISIASLIKNPYVLQEREPQGFVLTWASTEQAVSVCDEFGTQVWFGMPEIAATKVWSLFDPKTHGLFIGAGPTQIPNGSDAFDAGMRLFIRKLKVNTAAAAAAAPTIEKKKPQQQRKRRKASDTKAKATFSTIQELVEACNCKTENVSEKENGETLVLVDHLGNATKDEVYDDKKGLFKFAAKKLTLSALHAYTGDSTLPLPDTDSSALPIWWDGHRKVILCLTGSAKNKMVYLPREIFDTGMVIGIPFGLFRSTGLLVALDFENDKDFGEFVNRFATFYQRPASKADEKNAKNTLAVQFQYLLREIMMFINGTTAEGEEKSRQFMTSVGMDYGFDMMKFCEKEDYETVQNFEEFFAENNTVHWYKKNEAGELVKIAKKEKRQRKPKNDVDEEEEEDSEAQQKKKKKQQKKKKQKKEEEEEEEEEKARAGRVAEMKAQKSLNAKVRQEEEEEEEEQHPVFAGKGVKRPMAAVKGIKRPLSREQPQEEEEQEQEDDESFSSVSYQEEEEESAKKSAKN